MSALQRKNFLKPDLGSDNVIQKREEFAVSLRKQKTKSIVQMKRRKIAEQMQKRVTDENCGNIQMNLGQDQQESAVYTGYLPWKGPGFNTYVEILNSVAGPNSDQIDEISDKIAFLLSSCQKNDVSDLQKLAVLTKIRQELSSEDVTPDISKILAYTDILTVVFQILCLEASNEIYRFIQLEALWIASNLVYGEELDLILEFGQYGQPKFLDLLKGLIEKSDHQMLDQIMFMMGNITGTNKAIRQIVRQKMDLIQIITQAIQNKAPRAFGKNFIWVAGNLCIEHEQLTTQQVFSLMQIFQEYLNQKDEEMLVDITKSVAKLACSSNHEVIKLAAAKHSQFFSTMCDLLCHKNQDVFKEALNYVGGIMSIDDEWSNNMMIQNEVIEKITNILYSANAELIKCALWTQSNIVASGVPSVQAFLKTSAPQRVLTLALSPNINLQQESLWILCNAITCGSVNEVRDIFLIENGEVVNVLIKGLKLQYPKLVHDIVQSLYKLCQSDEQFNVLGQEESVFEKMEELSAYIYLETLNHHTNQKVFEAAQDLNALYEHQRDQLHGAEIEIEDRPYQQQANDQNMFSI